VCVGHLVTMCTVVVAWRRVESALASPLSPLLLQKRLEFS
jgi:hypothetical protein